MTGNSFEPQNLFKMVAFEKAEFTLIALKLKTQQFLYDWNSNKNQFQNSILRWLCTKLNSNQSCAVCCTWGHSIQREGVYDTTEADWNVSWAGGVIALVNWKQQQPRIRLLTEQILSWPGKSILLLPQWRNAISTLNTILFWLTNSFIPLFACQLRQKDIFACVSGRGNPSKYWLNGIWRKSVHSFVKLASLSGFAFINVRINYDGKQVKWFTEDQVVLRAVPLVLRKYRNDLILNFNCSDDKHI